MRIFQPKNIEDYEIMVEYMINIEPIFIYQSIDEHTYLVSDNEIENVEERISELLDERSTNEPVIEDEILTQTDLDELADYFYN